MTKYPLSFFREVLLKLVAILLPFFFWKWPSPLQFVLYVVLQHKKPTLVLWQGKKYRQFNQMFIHGIDSDILQVSEYELDDLYKTMTTFINKYENAAERNRFHLILNNVERNYLDWAQFTKNKSRTKVIKEALRGVIDGDRDYSGYLNKHEGE